MIPHGTESPTLSDMPSGPSRPWLEKFRVIWFKNYVSEKSRKLRNHEATKKIDKEKFDRDWLYEVKIAESNVDLKKKTIRILADVESMLDGHLSPTNFTEQRAWFIWEWDKGDKLRTILGKPESTRIYEMKNWKDALR